MKDVSLDCGGWAEGEKRERRRISEKTWMKERKKEMSVIVLFSSIFNVFSPGTLQTDSVPCSVTLVHLTCPPKEMTFD